MRFYSVFLLLMTVRLSSPFHGLSYDDLKLESHVLFDTLPSDDEVPPPPQAAAVSVLEMIEAQIFDANAGESFTESAVFIDPINDFPGILSAEWEVVCDMSTAPNTSRTVELVDELATVYASLTFTTPATTGILVKRQSTPFTPDPLNAHFYMIRTLTDTFDFSSRESCIKLVMPEKATASKFQVMMASGDQSSGGNADAWFQFSSRVAYGFFGFNADPPDLYEGDHYRFLKEEAKIGNIQTWEFEVEMTFAGANPGDTCDVALFRTSDNAMVAGSQITFNMASPLRQTVLIPNAAANFTNGSEFYVLARTPENAPIVHYVAQFFRIALYVKVAPLAQCLSYLKIGNTLGGGSFPLPAQDFNDTCRKKIDILPFKTGTTFFHESTARETGGLAHTFALDAGTADSGLPLLTSFAGAVVIVPPDPGWVNIAAILGPPDNNSTDVILPNGIITDGTLELSGFDFSLLPGTAIINGVSITAIEGLCGTQPTAIFRAFFTGLAVHAHVRPLNCPGFAILSSFVYDCSSDKAWTPADFAAPIIRVQGSQAVLNSDLFWDAVSIGVEFGENLANSQLDFSLINFERQRNGPLALINGNRYFPHYTSGVANTIDHSLDYIIAEVPS